MQSYPFITIAIPTKNATEYLPRFLNALYSISYPKHLQRITFFDDASDDDTPSHLMQFKMNHHQEYESVLVILAKEYPSYRTYPAVPQRISQARNICLENAIGDYFLSLDCDVIVEPDVITKLLSYFNTSTKIGATGISYYRQKLSFTDKIQIHQRKGLRDIHLTGGGCTMFKMDVLKLVGNFDESRWGMDTEIHQRISKSGFKTYLDFDTVYEHIKPTDSIVNTFAGVLKHSGYRYVEIKKNRPSNYIRQNIFFTIYLISIAFIVVSYIPFLIFTIIGFIFYFLRSYGIYRLINPFYCFVVGILYALSFYYHSFKDLFNLEEY